VAPPTETITTSGGTYTGPVNSAPASITAPPVSVSGGGSLGDLNPGGLMVGAPGTGATSPGNGGGTPGQTASTTTTVPTSIPDLFTIGGESYQEIGTITGVGGEYYGNEVSGGAPVYFGNDAGVSQLSGPSAIEAEPVGTNVYVPAADSGAVSATQGAAKF
jgi:hypothetical protein